MLIRAIWLCWGQIYYGADVSRFKSRINGWSGQCVVAHDFPHGGSGCRFLAGVTLHQKEHVNHQDLAKLFFAALQGIVLNQGSFIFGVSLTSPINASIVTTTTPIITMIIAAFYLKEPVTGKR